MLDHLNDTILVEGMPAREGDALFLRKFACIANAAETAFISIKTAIIFINVAICSLGHIMVDIHCLFTLYHCFLFVLFVLIIADNRGIIILY